MTTGNIEEPLIQALNILKSSDEASQLLLGNLVKFLAEKGVVDLQEYLEATQDTMEAILQKTAVDDDLKKAVEVKFKSHINDFKKPD